MSDIGSIVVEGRMVTFNISASVAGCEDGVHGIMLRSEHRRQIDAINRIHREDEDVWDLQMKVMMKKVQEARDVVASMFNQHCGEWDGDVVTYNHGCLSVNEEAQSRLIEWGMIKPEQCSRG